MQHLESAVFWGIILLVAGALLLLDALGVGIALSSFFGILLLVAGALVLLRVLRLESSRPRTRRGGGAAAMEYLESGLVWSILLLVAGALLVLDGLGLEIVSDAFWGIAMLVVGALMLLRALGGGGRR